MAARAKPRLSIVVIGHVDSGKSTTTGHMLFKCGALDERAVAKAAEIAEANNKASFSFAYLLDRQKASRERGITIDTATMAFATPVYAVTVIDAPGHRDFIRNMITGTSQADAALLVVDGSVGGFEAGISENGQTREHALLAYTLGVKDMIIAVNKMDATSYSEARFNEIVEFMTDYAKRIGFAPKRVTCVPICGFAGDNLIERSPNMPWWTGPTLRDAIDALPLPARPTDKPLRMPVQATYKISGVGAVVCGRVETGFLKPAMSVVVAPSGAAGVVKSVEQDHVELPDGAGPGDNVGFSARGLTVKDLRRGYVVGEAGRAPPTAVRSFTAQVVVLNHPSEIRAGYSPILACHTASVACRFDELLQTLDRRTGAVKDAHPESIKKGDAAIVRLVPQKPLCVESFAEIPPLGRFAVRDMRNTVAVGVVKDVDR